MIRGREGVEPLLLTEKPNLWRNIKQVIKCFWNFLDEKLLEYFKVNVRNRNIKNYLHLYLAVTSESLLLLDVILSYTFKLSYSYNLYRQKIFRAYNKTHIEKSDKINSLTSVHVWFLYGCIQMLINLLSCKGGVRRVKPPSICDCKYWHMLLETRGQKNFQSPSFMSLMWGR